MNQTRRKSPSRFRKYSPYLCKTCQKIGSRHPKIARTLYSDCEKHYQERVKTFALKGVRVISSSSKKAIGEFWKEYSSSTSSPNVRAS